MKKPLLIAVTLLISLTFVRGVEATHVLSVDIDPVATWDPVTKEITVTGTISCDDSAFVNTVAVESVTVTQNTNKNNPRTGTTGSGAVEAAVFSPCDPPATFAWSVPVASDGAAFTPGRVEVTVVTSCCHDFSSPIFETVTVMVIGPRPAN